MPGPAVIEERIPAIEALGYLYVPEHETDSPERRYFRKPREGARTHHLHAVETGSAFRRDHLAFRDALRVHPAWAAGYAALKRALAERHRDDRAAYTEGKTAFVSSVLARWG